MFKVFTTLSSNQKKFLLIWALALLIIGISSGVLLIQTESKNLQDSLKKHSDRMDPNKTEQGKTQPEKNPPPGHEKDIPLEVKIGMYIDRISALSIKDSFWTADFYVWFRWQGDGFQPDDHFQVINGSMSKPVKLEEKTTASGEHYVLYRVTEAKITKVFDTKRFPRDDHLLTISIEPTDLQSYQLHFVADEASNISSRVSVPGYQVYKAQTVVKPHSYKTTRGDFGLPNDYKATYSQFNYGIWIQHPSWSLFYKMFITLFAAVLIPMVGFFTTPTHRLTVSGTAFFGAVAATYVTSTVVPDTGIATMTDIIDGIGIVIIAIIIFQTVIAQQIFEKHKQEDFSDAFDYVTFAVLFGIFIWLMIAIPYAASLPTYPPLPV